MKKAIPLEGRLNPLEVPRSEVLKLVAKKSYGTFGEVQACKLPDFLIPSKEQVLELLKDQTKGKFSENAQHGFSEGPTLVFGKGSIPTHRDEITGFTLLTFLGGFNSKGKDIPEEDSIVELFHEGELYTSGSRTLLKGGQSVIFDDREEHSWMHNAGWVFMCIPLKKRR
jgi:hypothetical protein